MQAFPVEVKELANKSNLRVWLVVPPLRLLPEMVPWVAPLVLSSGQTNNSVGEALGADVS